MWEFHYNGTDTQLKIWFDTITKAEITLVDGIRKHPWLDVKVLDENFLVQSMSTDSQHELGDSWYNFTSPGKAYLFVKSTDGGATVTFNYGYKPLFPKWAIILIASLGGFFVLICLFICCCYVRRQAKKNAEESSRVKKYQTTEANKDDRFSKFKYGRQSIPIQLPELAENGDEMKKPDEDGYYDDKGYDEGLEF